MVPVYALLLFGGSIVIKHAEGLLHVDGWVLKAPARIAVLVRSPLVHSSRPHVWPGNALHKESCHTRPLIREPAACTWLVGCSLATGVLLCHCRRLHASLLPALP